MKMSLHWGWKVTIFSHMGHQLHHMTCILRHMMCHIGYFLQKRSHMTCKKEKIQ